MTAPRRPVLFGGAATIVLLLSGIAAGTAAQAMGVTGGWQLVVRTAAHAVIAGLLLWAVRGWPEAQVRRFKSWRGLLVLWLPLVFVVAPWTTAGLAVPAGFSLPALIFEEGGTGLAEEALCRGFLLAILLRAWGRSNAGVRRAVLVQGVIFGVAHIVVGDPVVVVTATVGGVLFGAVTVRLASFWPLVFIHAFGNLGYQLAPSDGGGGTGSLVVAVLTIVVTLSYSAFLLRDSVLVPISPTSDGELTLESIP